MQGNITFSIGVDVLFVLFIAIILFFGLWIYHIVSMSRTPLNARVDARILIERASYRVGEGTIAEAEKAEKEFMRADIMAYLEELKRVVNVILE